MTLLISALLPQLMFDIKILDNLSGGSRSLHLGKSQAFLQQEVNNNICHVIIGDDVLTFRVVMSNVTAPALSLLSLDIPVFCVDTEDISWCKSALTEHWSRCLLLMMAHTLLRSNKCFGGSALLGGGGGRCEGITYNELDISQIVNCGVMCDNDVVQ